MKKEVLPLLPGFQNSCLFVRNRRDTIQYHGGLQSRELGQAPTLQVFLTPRQASSSHPRQQNLLNRWSDYIGYRIEIECLIGVLSTILHTSHTMKSSDPLLLVNGTFRCGMYPAGKVAISRHLVTPGFPRCDHTVDKLIADAGVY